MTSTKKTAANRRNALASTGPKTARGKAASARNATRHGILSRLEVLPGVECPEDWADHLDAVLADLQPAGHLQTALAERVALNLWRLGRVARYEREVAALSLESVKTDAGDPLEALVNPGMDAPKRAAVRVQRASAELDFVAGLLKLPDEEAVDPDLAAYLLDRVAKAVGVNLYGDGADVRLPSYPNGTDLPDGIELAAVAWTARHLRSSLAVVIDYGGEDLDEVMAALVSGYEGRVEKARAELSAVELEASRLRRRRVLPDGPELDKVGRYEGHLERSLFRTLHELQRLQAARIGGTATSMGVDEGAAA